MIISMLNYQVDEYMETTVGQYSSNLEPIKQLIRRLCGQIDNKVAEKSQDISLVEVETVFLVLLLTYCNIPKS
jgi:hypothetical protein